MTPFYLWKWFPSLKAKYYCKGTGYFYHIVLSKFLLRIYEKYLQYSFSPLISFSLPSCLSMVLLSLMSGNKPLLAAELPLQLLSREWTAAFNCSSLAFVCCLISSTSVLDFGFSLKLNLTIFYNNLNWIETVN